MRCFRNDLTKTVNLGIKTLRITRKHVADEKMIRPRLTLNPLSAFLTIGVFFFWTNMLGVSSH